MRDTAPKQRMLTFAGGGWVIAVAGFVALALITWAIWPAISQVMQRPPGDGQRVESYGFDLSTLTVSRDSFIPVMLHRDMVPVLDDPEIMTAEEAIRITEEQRGKFLVSTDRVIGVVINNEARAYPLQLMNVHELVNDTLGGVPIAVTYSWLGDIPRVFDRRPGGEDGELLEFGISGLVTNTNSLLYDRRPSHDEGEEIPWDERGESLWRQLDGQAVSGPAAQDGLELRPINAQLVSWRQWYESYPETTVLARDPMLLKRYRRSSPDQYFLSATIPYPVDNLPPKPDPHGAPTIDLPPLEWKSRVVVVRDGEHTRIFPHRVIAAETRRSAGGGTDDSRRWRTQVGESEIVFTFDSHAETVAVQAPADVEFVHCFWFLWYAHHPETAEDALVSGE